MAKSRDLIVNLLEFKKELFLQVVLLANPLLSPSGAGILY
jgi:hypothetical protein